jgi:hypothetical protein
VLIHDLIGLYLKAKNLAKLLAFKIKKKMKENFSHLDAHQTTN